MGKRILSTVLLWLLVFGVMWKFGTTGAVVLVGLISVLTLREFYALLAGAGHQPFRRLGMTFGALVTLSPWLQQHIGIPKSSDALVLAVIVFSLRILSEREPLKRVEALTGVPIALVSTGFERDDTILMQHPLN